MNLKRRKQPISDEGGVHHFSSTQALHPDSRNSEERSRPVRPRFACPSRQVISLECLRLACAVQRRRFPVGASPTRQPLQPEAIGAVMEVTKWLKPSISVSQDW